MQELLLICTLKVDLRGRWKLVNLLLEIIIGHVFSTCISLYAKTFVAKTTIMHNLLPLGEMV